MGRNISNSRIRIPQRTTWPVPKIVGTSSAEIWEKVVGAAPERLNQPSHALQFEPTRYAQFSNPSLPISRNIGNSVFDGPFRRISHSQGARHQPYSIPHQRSCVRNFRCTLCRSMFQRDDQLQQHKRTCHRLPWHETESQPRRAYIEKFLEDSKVIGTKEDTKSSKATVKYVLDNLMHFVRKQSGGKMYIPDIHSAGSNAVGVKIGLADEFDTNIPIQIDVNGIQTAGYLTYAYADKVCADMGGPSPTNLNTPRRLFDFGRAAGIIPEGHVSVKVTKNTTPASLLHNDDLIPYKVLQDFYTKSRGALRMAGLENCNVCLSKEAHGPALTLTIRHPTGRHDINVDLTLSLITPYIPIDAHGWPRPDTYKAYSKEKIEEVKNAGVHLVPKGDETWSISYSRAEKALLRDIDADGGCRKAVLKFMKRHFQICKSRSINGLPGLSSHIIKTQLLWSIEKRPWGSYWQRSNIDECVLDTTWDLNRSLTVGILHDYFNPSINVLKDKGRFTCLRFANYLQGERQRIRNSGPSNPMLTWYLNTTRHTR